MPVAPTILPVLTPVSSFTDLSSRYATQKLTAADLGACTALKSSSMSSTAAGKDSSSSSSSEATASWMFSALPLADMGPQTPSLTFCGSSDRHNQLHLQQVQLPSNGDPTLTVSSAVAVTAHISMSAAAKHPGSRRCSSADSLSSTSSSGSGNSSGSGSSSNWAAPASPHHSSSSSSSSSSTSLLQSITPELLATRTVSARMTTSCMKTSSSSSSSKRLQHLSSLQQQQQQLSRADACSTPYMHPATSAGPPTAPHLQQQQQQQYRCQQHEELQASDAATMTALDERLAQLLSLRQALIANTVTAAAALHAVAAAAPQRERRYSHPTPHCSSGYAPVQYSSSSSSSRRRGSTGGMYHHQVPAATRTNSHGSTGTACLGLASAQPVTFKMQQYRQGPSMPAAPAVRPAAAQFGADYGAYSSGGMRWGDTGSAGPVVLEELCYLQQQQQWAAGGNCWAAAASGKGNVMAAAEERLWQLERLQQLQQRLREELMVLLH
uniref:Uncharacterized protein n=1 Tax=Tetradesmus obliquus TaxID=3088 RepID=A0A383W8Y4_TETOB